MPSWNIIDGTNIERNLYSTTQSIELGKVPSSRSTHRSGPQERRCDRPEEAEQRAGPPGR